MNRVLVLAIQLASLLLSPPLFAQDHVHSPQAEEPAHVHGEAESPNAVDHSAMSHEDMNHSATDHSAMNHDEANQEAMDHSGRDHSAINHDEANQEAVDHSVMDHSAMDHSAMNHDEMTDMQAAPVRDPHAYSGGFARDSGPYSLPQQPQVHLADETVFSGLWMDRFEYVDHSMGEGAELEGYGWFGNSYRQLLIQAQIETVEGEIEEGEVDLLFSQAISPFWDVRLGMHRSFGENVDRDWAVVGIKGLAPYWFELDARLHLGENGRSAMDIEAEYELLLTQRLVLQPRIDISAFGKTDAELGRGSGLSTIKTGVRLRYEFSRQFAPYIGVERVSRFGETADLLPAGADKSETHWVMGLRYWF